jgi:hypothetical protein
VANVKPPAHYAQTPELATLSAGSILFRVHQKRFPAEAFNPELSHRYYGGGRFDATDDDPYPYLYAGTTVDVAVAETLLRDLSPDDVGIRQLAVPKVAGRRISAIEVTANLELVSLRSGTDLGAVAQDTWLTMCDPRDYAQSRHWAHWIRSHAKSAAGYVWLSRREPGAAAYVLFGDRFSPTAIVSTAHPDVPNGDEADFDTPRGRRALRRRLTRYGVALSRR